MNEWTVKFCDNTGAVLAQAPGAAIGQPTEILNDAWSIDATVGLDEPRHAAVIALIDAVTPSNPLTAIEMQVYRGDTLIFPPAPCFNTRVDVNAGTLTISAKTLEENLKRRVVGQIGAGFGNNLLADPWFTGSGWSTFRVTSGAIGAIPAGSILANAGGHPYYPGPGFTVRFTAPTGSPDDTISLYQILTITTPVNRDITVRFSGYWWVPSGAGFHPTTQRFNMLVARYPTGINPITNYGLVIDRAFSTMGWDTPKNQWLLDSCEIKIPANHTEQLVIAWCPPEGVSYCAPVPVPLTGDDGFDYVQADTAGIAGQLLLHAQDAAYGKTDLRITDASVPCGIKTNQVYQFAQHTPIWSAITALGQSGGFDFGVVATPTTRALQTWTPMRGSYQPACRCIINAQGEGTVVSIEPAQAWSSASTDVEQASTVMTRQGKQVRFVGFAHAGANEVLEEASTAVKEGPPMLLNLRAADRLQVASHPTTITVTTKPGDETRLLGLGIGDWTDVLCTLPGRKVNGLYRVSKRVIDPNNESMVLTMNLKP